MDKKFILICFLLWSISSIIIFMIGFSAGVQTTIKAGIKIAVRLIELKKIDVYIDEDMIRKGIMQYNNNLAGCMFLDNATAFYNPNIQPYRG